jgi:hypothetical protein
MCNRSRLNLHSSGVGLGTMCTSLHSLAVECLITPNSSSWSYCCLILDCFSTECVRGGSLCLLDFHFVSSILMDMGGTSADSARTVVSKMSEFSSHRARNFRCRLGGPFILIKSIIDEPVVAGCGLYSNGSSVNSISSSSSTDSMMSLRCLIVAKVGSCLPGFG